MAQKIYVGNLNYATTEEGLTNLFGTYGEVVSTKKSSKDAAFALMSRRKNPAELIPNYFYKG